MITLRIPAIVTSSSLATNAVKAILRLEIVPTQLSVQGTPRPRFEQGASSLGSVPKNGSAAVTQGLKRVLRSRLPALEVS